jgi:hypothetical protein
MFALGRITFRQEALVDPWNQIMIDRFLTALVTDFSAALMGHDLAQSIYRK